MNMVNSGLNELEGGMAAGLRGSARSALGGAEMGDRINRDVFPVSWEGLTFFPRNQSERAAFYPSLSPSKEIPIAHN
jgi:hypothetical protein